MERIHTVPAHRLRLIRTVATLQGAILAVSAVGAALVVIAGDPAQIVAFALTLGLAAWMIRAGTPSENGSLRARRWLRRTEWALLVWALVDVGIVFANRAPIEPFIRLIQVGLPILMILLIPRREGRITPKSEVPQPEGVSV